MSGSKARDCWDLGGPTGRVSALSDVAGKKWESRKQVPTGSLQGTRGRFTGVRQMEIRLVCLSVE